MLKIQLTAQFELAQPFSDYTYKYEGNGQEVFKVGECLKEIFERFPVGELEMGSLPETDKLIKEIALESSDRALKLNDRIDVNLSNFKPLSYNCLVKKARDNLPETSAEFDESEEDVGEIISSEEDEAKSKLQKARKVLKKSRAQEIIDQAVIKAVDEHISMQVRSTHLDRTSSVSMAIKGGQPMITYIFNRIHSGDRARAVKLFLAARLFDPVYVSSITLDNAHVLIKDLSIFPRIDRDLRDGLKLELPQYKDAATRAVSAGMTECKDILN